MSHSVVGAAVSVGGSVNSKAYSHTGGNIRTGEEYWGLLGVLGLF